MSTTITKQKKSKRQSIDFDDEIEKMSDAEFIESLKPKNLPSGEPPLFSSLPKKVQADIRAAQREVAAGRFVSNEDVFSKIDEWLEND